MTNLELALDMPRSREVAAAVSSLAEVGGVEERGAVFTKPGVVEAILDLCGYTADRRLQELRLLEPSFGDGSFLLVAVDRLITAFVLQGGDLSEAAHALAAAVRGFELHNSTFQHTQQRVRSLLVRRGVPQDQASRLVATWLVKDDFLLATIDGAFDVVVGNPPYVRQERLPGTLLKTYKRKFTTLYDRADLYVLFYERGLDLLSVQGVLGYICANRWLKNKYGGPLRQKVAEGFWLKYFVDLEQADAFQADVLAYPAITIIERGTAGPTQVALGCRESGVGLNALVDQLQRPRSGKAVHGVAVVRDVTAGRDPWLLDAPHIVKFVRQLERSLPTLEESGARVGIGVATGADQVFLGEYEALPVESARKLKLAMAADCVNGAVAWGGKGVVNPYLGDGTLARLSEFPRFAAYVEMHEEKLRRRHTAKKQPNKWYRTIDRIYPDLTCRPKLLIPDIKANLTVSFDPGEYYPHHNLYVVTSETWDLRALQAILRSSVALTFVAAYSVRMAGGFLRFQAQYLRRIRVPNQSTLTARQVDALVAVASSTDQREVDAVVMPMYGLGADAHAELLAHARATLMPRNRTD